MKKRILSILLSMVFCMTSVMTVATTAVSAADEVVPVYLDGNPIKFPANDAQPQIISNRTYVPIRATCDALGLSIDWNSKTETLTFTREGIVISHTMRSNTVYVNGKATDYDTKSINKNNRTLMPIRMLGDSIGATVEWDNSKRSVLIATEKKTNANTSSDAAINNISSSEKEVENGKSVTVTAVANSSTDKVKFVNGSTGNDITEVNEYISGSDGTRSFEAKVECVNDTDDDTTLTVKAVPGTSAGGYSESSDAAKSVDVKVKAANDSSKDDDDDDDNDNDSDEEVVKSFESEHFVKLVYNNSIKKNGYTKFTITTDDEVKRVKVDSTAADEEVVLKEYDEDGDERVFEGRIKLTSTGSQKIKIDLYLSKGGYEEINEAFKVEVGSGSSSKDDDEDEDDDDGEILDVEIVNDAFYTGQASPVYVTTSTGIDYIEVLSDEDRVCGKTSFTTSKTSSEKLWTVDVTVSEKGRNKYTINAYKDDEIVDDYDVTLNGRSFNRTDPIIVSMDQKSTTVKAGDEVRFTAKVTGCVSRIDVRKDSGGGIIGTSDSSPNSSSTKSMTVSFEVNSFDSYYTAYAYDERGNNSTYTFRITGDTYQEIEITDIEIEDDRVPFGDPVSLTVYTTNSCEKLWIEDSRGQRVSRTYTNPDDEDGTEYVWECDFSSIDDDFKNSRTFTIIAQDEDKETDEKTITIHFTNN